MSVFRSEIIKRDIKTLNLILENKEVFDIFISKGCADSGDTECLCITYTIPKYKYEDGFYSIDLELLNHMDYHEQLEIKGFHFEKYKEYIPEVIKHIEYHIKYKLIRFKVDLEKIQNQNIFY